MEWKKETMKRALLITLPTLVSSGMLTATDTGPKRTRALRLHHNQDFIERYGLCPAGKWKIPSAGQQVRVPGVFKPRFDGQPLTVGEVIIESIGQQMLRLKDAVTGQELPVVSA